MKDWNVVVTSTGSSRKAERLLLEELRQLGEFAPTGFRSVFLGRVDDKAVFIEDVARALEEMPAAWEGLARVVPIDATLSFEPEGFDDAVAELALGYAPRLSGHKFIVRAKRRGYKGRISSLEVEQRVSGLIHDRIKEEGGEAGTDFEDPDFILAVEIFPNRVGTALLSRELMQRHPFVKVK